MTPQWCHVRHDPPHTYGDCLRACVATVLDMQWDEVPHFAADGVDGDAAMAHMRRWSAEHGLAPFITAYPGEIALTELLDMHRTINPDSVYVLFGGATDGGDHCVVCCGGKIEHNPAWVGGRIVGPLSNGTWQCLVMGRVW